MKEVFSENKTNVQNLRSEVRVESKTTGTMKFTFHKPNVQSSEIVKQIRDQNSGSILKKQNTFLSLIRRDSVKNKNVSAPEILILEQKQVEENLCINDVSQTAATDRQHCTNQEVVSVKKSSRIALKLANKALNQSKDDEETSSANKISQKEQPKSPLHKKAPFRKYRAAPVSSSDDSSSNSVPFNFKFKEKFSAGSTESSSSCQPTAPYSEFLESNLGNICGEHEIIDRLVQDEVFARTFITGLESYIRDLPNKNRIERPQNTKNLSRVYQLAQMKWEGQIDLTSSQSIMATRKLSDFINVNMFSKLPLYYQQKLALLLPKCDQTRHPEGFVGPSSKLAFHNNYLTSALESFRRRLANGFFSERMIAKRKADLSRLRSNKKLNAKRLELLKHIREEKLKKRMARNNKASREESVDENLGDVVQDSLEKRIQGPILSLMGMKRVVTSIDKQEKLMNDKGSNSTIKLKVDERIFQKLKGNNTGSVQQLSNVDNFYRKIDKPSKTKFISFF